MMNSKGRSSYLWSLRYKTITVKHIVTERMKYERDRHRTEMDESFDTELGPETEDNAKMMKFLKLINVIHTISRYL